MKWQKERDDLIAQTKAFVQSVTGRTPQAVLGSVFSKPAPVENPLEDPFAVLAPVSPPPLPLKQDAAVISAETKPPETKAAKVKAPEARPAEATPIEQDLPAAPSPGDVRKEIQTRVAAFQAHQHRFHRERDAYFNSVLSKARSAIEDGPDVPSS
jgi:hypothetical protein